MPCINAFNLFPTRHPRPLLPAVPQNLLIELPPRPLHVGVVPEDGDDPVAALGRVDEPAGDLPGLHGVEPHVPIERTVHDREGDL